MFYQNWLTFSQEKHISVFFKKLILFLFKFYPGCFAVTLPVHLYSLNSTYSFTECFHLWLLPWNPSACIHLLSKRQLRMTSRNLLSLISSRYLEMVSPPLNCSASTLHLEWCLAYSFNHNILASLHLEYIKNLLPHYQLCSYCQNLTCMSLLSHHTSLNTDLLPSTLPFFRSILSTKVRKIILK